MIKRKGDFLAKSVFLGKSKDLKEFLNNELKYPKDAILKKIEGKVYLKYKINPQGKVYDVFVIKGIGYGCNEEAVRLVKLLKYSIPSNRKIKVTTSKNLIITFKLPKPLNNVKINYTIV